MYDQTYKMGIVLAPVVLCEKAKSFSFDDSLIFNTNKRTCYHVSSTSSLAR